MILINFKNYKTGNEALKLARLIEKYLPKAIVAVSATDIEGVSKNTKLKVYARHVDYLGDKKGTGFITAGSIKRDGAEGTILNHSEHPIQFEILRKTIENCKKNKLKTLVCVRDLTEAKIVMRWKPDAIAFEEPSLIATGKPITEYRTKELEEFVKLIKRTKIIPLCGAGISTIEDVKAAYAMGCGGVLIASAIANAKHPEEFLRELQDITIKE